MRKLASHQLGSHQLGSHSITVTCSILRDNQFSPNIVLVYLRKITWVNLYFSFRNNLQIINMINDA